MEHHSERSPDSRERRVIPRGEGLRAFDRVRLTFEILAAYVELWRLLRRNDLEAMVAGARTIRRPSINPPSENAHAVAVRLGWIVQRIVRLLPTDKRCLINSLVLVRVLAHRSIETTLVIGVDSYGEVLAHAWVEHEGRPVLEPREFRRLLEL